MKKKQKQKNESAFSKQMDMHRKLNACGSLETEFSFFFFFFSFFSFFCLA